MVSHDHLNSGDYKLNYIIEGTGSPTLVIGSSHFYSRVFSAEVKQSLQMIFADHRGFASNRKPFNKEDFSLEQILQDLDLMRSKLGHDKVIILGHSAHGYLALEYARRYPRHVSHVVVVATGPSHGSHMQLAERHWEESVDPVRKTKYQSDMNLLKHEIEADPDKRFIHYCRRMAARGWFNPSFDPTPLWNDVDVYMPGLDYLFGETFRDIKVEDAITQITHPVFMAMGRFDFQVAPHWSWDPYRPLFSNLTFKVFDKSAHYPQYEESEVFDHELLGWLKGTGGI